VPWVPIDDPRDPRIAPFVGLRDRELARRVAPGGHGVFIAEGDVVAERALRAGYEPLAVLVDAARSDPLPLGIDAGVPVYAAAPAVLQRITGLGVHRGLLACFERRPPRPAAEVLDTARRVVVLERVSNPTNLGVILRSAAGLGMDAALLDPTCSDPLYRRTARVAMGEGYGFPWAWIPRLPGGLDVLRAHGFRLVALTPDDGAVPVDELAVDGAEGGGVDGRDERVALLFGAEGPGLSPGTLAAADVRAGIPMWGGVDSLNVGVAAGIAFWVLGRTGRHRD
jgi:tRNA G18 (ribose-2'-O)-methylase SpoU